MIGMKFKLHDGNFVECLSEIYTKPCENFDSESHQSHVFVRVIKTGKLKEILLDEIDE